MNYRHHARKIIHTSPKFGLVDAIARALRHAEFEGAKIATLTAANNAAKYIEQSEARKEAPERMEVLRAVLAGAYVPPPLK
jgi:hypothetical protein